MDFAAVRCPFLGTVSVTFCQTPFKFCQVLLVLFCLQHLLLSQIDSVQLDDSRLSSPHCFW